ncbi:MAG: dienelactone hydrolase family protein [Akkermansiaceae bacterium]
MKVLFALFLAVVVAKSANGEIVERDVSYQSGGVTLEGFHAYDDKIDGKRPGILIIHQWTGLSENEKMRARMLAELGYNVFAADVYGKGVRPQPLESGKVSGKYKEDRELFRARMMAGLEVLKNDERTDAKKIAAIGYCFGGTGVLEMARGGVELAGVVSFHGGLGAKEGMAAEKGKISAKLLVLHGAVDPYVSAAEVESFKQEMEDAEADWQLVMFGGAVHAFTQKTAGDDPSKGVAYDKEADERSWVHMRQFFEELF